MSEQPAREPVMCPCGMFFGSDATEGLCSGCYKQAHGGAAKPKPTSAGAQQQAEQPKSTASSADAKPAAQASQPEQPQQPQPQQQQQQSHTELAPPASQAPKASPKSKNRCGFGPCKTKLTLIQQGTNLCQCGLSFCHNHRHAEQHQCSFDHKTLGRENLNLEGTDKHAGRGIHRLESCEPTD